MSCQKALLRTSINSQNISISAKNNNRCDNYITTSNEDPYVFTEAIPTTPPAFFNTQKSRTRLIEVNSVALGATNKATTLLTFATNKLHQNHYYKPAEKQQQHSIVVDVDNFKNAKTLMNSPTTFSNKVDEVYGTVPLVKDISAISAHHIVSDNKTPFQPTAITSSGSVQLQSGVKKVTNVCIVRPQQQQHCQLSVDSSIPGEVKPLARTSTASLSSPYAQTSSIWQTPLLLDGLQRVPVSNSCPQNSNINSTNQCHSNSGSDGNGTSTNTIPTTTAMAKVAPIVMHTVPPMNVHSTKLPPSKFHQNTMAQQLQKVEILKKPNLKCNDAMAVQSPSPSSQVLMDAPVKHSKNAESFNDIPVNVILRMAVVPGDKIKEPLKCENKSLTSSLSMPSSALNSQDHPPSSLETQNRECSTPALTNALLYTNVGNNNRSYNNNNVMSSIELLGLNKKANNTVLPLQEKSHFIDVKTNNENLTPIKTLTKIQNSNNGITIAPSPVPKKSRKAANPTWQVSSTIKGGVAVIKMSHAEASNDISLMASTSSLPYCLQHNWLSTYSIEPLPITAVTINREERIIKHKKQLRHKAEQLLSIRSLQKLPFQLAKKRLLCVKRLLYKYNQQKTKKGCVSLNPLKHCAVSGCDSWCIEMASYCQNHIVRNANQQLFVPCAIKYVDDDHCDASVFDVIHDLPLCVEHSQRRNELSNLFKEQEKLHRILPVNATVLMPQPQLKQSKHSSQQQTHTLLPQDNNSHFILSKNAPTSLKRKLHTLNSKGRPQKRTKKVRATVVNCNKNVLQSSSSTVQRHPIENLPIILNRNSSAISLESIANDSYQSPSLSTSINYTQNSNKGMERILASLGPDSHSCDIHNNNTIIPPLNLLSCNNKMHNNFKKNESNNSINQFALTNHHPRQQYQHQNEHQFNLISNSNSNSNYTSSGVGSTASLLSGDDIFTQDMLNICENTSASSADTGLGGVSDPELMLNDATDSDIRLSEDHLLEEHVLDNVLSFLPEDTFKEIFATVHLDENDEIERAIEIADKSLKTLQQTIGSGLSDFLEFSDDILTGPTEFVNDTASCAPIVVDNSALFMDGNRNGNVDNNGSDNGGPNLTECHG